MPDLLRLLPRLAADRALPHRVRAGLAFLLAYLASPIDLVPDFIPVLGSADDAVVVAIVLRWDALGLRTPGPRTIRAGLKEEVKRALLAEDYQIANGRHADHLTEHRADGLPDGLGAKDSSHLAELAEIDVDAGLGYPSTSNSGAVGPGTRRWLCPR